MLDIAILVRADIGSPWLPVVIITSWLSQLLIFNADKQTFGDIEITQLCADFNDIPMLRPEGNLLPVLC